MIGSSAPPAFLGSMYDRSTTQVRRRYGVAFSMRKALILVMLSFATRAAADDLDRAIALFKDGAVVQAIGVASTLP